VILLLMKCESAISYTKLHNIMWVFIAKHYIGQIQSPLHQI